jgi:hypothetical protein
MAAERTIAGLTWAAASPKSRMLAISWLFSSRPSSTVSFVAHPARLARKKARMNAVIVLFTTARSSPQGRHHKRWAVRRQWD